MLFELVTITEKSHTLLLERNIEINLPLSSFVSREHYNGAIETALIEFNLILGFWYWLNFIKGQCLLSCKAFGGKMFYNAHNESQNIACCN